MAALIVKTNFEVTKRQSLCALSVAVQICHYSDSPRIIKDPVTSNLYRGTGGRSSFSGIVCTVFGGSGFLSRYVCNHLGKIGSQMIIPYRGDIYRSQHLKVAGDLGQVLFHPFSLNDEESIRKCVKYSNTVINLIGRDWETKNFTFEDVHVDAARRIARISKEAGVERFIQVSALNAHPNPPPLMLPKGSGILRAKWNGERAVKEEFPEAIIIRPADVYANDDTFVNGITHRVKRRLRAIPLWHLGNDTEKQPVYAGDVAAGIVAVIQDPNSFGKTYQFVGPKRYVYSELVRWIYALLRKEKSWGFRIQDIMRHRGYHLKIFLNERCTQFRPFGTLTWEILEKDHNTDRIKRNLPTLEDLGITPVEIENQLPCEVIHLVDHNTTPSQTLEYEPLRAPETTPIVYF